MLSRPFRCMPCGHCGKYIFMVEDVMKIAGYCVTSVEQVKQTIHFCVFSVCMMCAVYAQKLTDYKVGEMPFTPPCAWAAIYSVLIFAHMEKTQRWIASLTCMEIVHA